MVEAHSILANKTIGGGCYIRPDILPNPQCGAFTKEDGEAVVDAAGNRVAKPAP